MGFKEFLFRGNLIQLAVAVVIGTAFANVVKAITEGMITPLLGVFGGVPEFKEETFVIRSSSFKYGMVIDSLLTFFLTALILYYIIVLPSDWLLSRTQKKAEESTRSCPECCSKMDKAAKRCPFCTSDVTPAPPKEGGEGDAMIA